ncbi:MAG: YtxH domain-containing protein [Bacteroidia bacterium]
MKSGKGWLGLLAGLAAGAVIGVLLAPDKGKVTRKKIIEKGEDLAENLKQKFNDFVDDIVDKSGSTKKENKETEGKADTADDV